MLLILSAIQALYYLSQNGIAWIKKINFPICTCCKQYFNYFALSFLMFFLPLLLWIFFFCCFVLNTLQSYNRSTNISLYNTPYKFVRVFIDTYISSLKARICDLHNSRLYLHGWLILWCSITLPERIVFICQHRNVIYNKRL